MLGVVLAAGEGVRIRPLSLERPKPLLPTLDLPQLAWALAGLRWAGVERAWVNAHAHHEVIRARAVESARVLGLEVRMSYEHRQPLGTAGALRRIAYYLEEPFVVVNSDVATDAPVGALIQQHKDAGAAATLLAIPEEEEADLLVEDGAVKALIDRRTTRSPGFRFGGAAVLQPEVLGYIPEGPSGLFETVLSGLVRDGGSIAAHVWDGYWLDIGTPEAHLAANLDALSGALDDRGIPQYMLDGWQRWDPQAYIGDGARCAGVELAGTVVGRGARLAPGSRLERCVVWDGASVPRGTYRNAVLTASQVVQAGPANGEAEDEEEG